MLLLAVLMCYLLDAPVWVDLIVLVLLVIKVNNMLKQTAKNYLIEEINSTTDLTRKLELLEQLKDF